MHRLFELKQAPSDWTFSKVEVQTDGVAGWQSCTPTACTRIACTGIRSVTGIYESTNLYLATLSSPYFRVARHALGITNQGKSMFGFPNAKIPATRSLIDP